MAGKQQYTFEEKAQFRAKRNETMQSLSEQLKAAVATIQNSEDFKNYLKTQALFHTYSYRNTLLIITQCPHATIVTGYTTWMKLGRQVRKGEKGIRICAPMHFHKEGANGEQEDHVGFRPVSVFDISQTDGEPLNDMNIQNLTGDEGEALYAALVRVAETWNMRVHEGAHHDTNGSYHPTTSTITVKTQARTQMVKTLVHEIAHGIDPCLNQSTTAEAETVAEGVAFLTLAHFGIDSSNYSFPYIAEWNGDVDGQATLTRCMDRIQKIAKDIIDVATHHLEEETATAPFVA